MIQGTAANVKFDVADKVITQHAPHIFSARYQVYARGAMKMVTRFVCGKLAAEGETWDNIESLEWLCCVVSAKRNIGRAGRGWARRNIRI